MLSICQPIEADTRVALPKTFDGSVLLRRHHQIATLDRTMRGDNLAAEEKYEKITRIFSWSVYLSHAGLARYPNQEHSIRALEILSGKTESEESDVIERHSSVC
jgi:hypothetical protein